MVNSKRIKSKIIEKGLTQEYIADKMRLSQSAFNLKLNNSRYFRIEEMFGLADLLEIDYKELKQYFFKQ
jgi:transcriptional regulator with XRE-family HTH domain